MGNITLTTTEYVTPFYYDGDTSNPGYGAIAVTLTDANYIPSTNKIRIAYSISLRRKPKSSGYYGYTYYTASSVSIGGTEVFSEYASANSWLRTSWNNGDVLGTGTVDISANKGTTQSIALYAKGMFRYGYSATRWNDNTGCTSGSSSTSAAVPADPSISVSISASTQASRGGSTGKATATASGASAGTNGGTYSYSLTNNGSTVNNTATKEATGLKNNTTYYYSASISNSYNLTYSTGNKSYYLTPIKPGLTASASPTRTTATITLTPSYDTLRKFGSYSVKYGTSASNLNLSATSGSLSSLTPNTKYYYSATVTDANNGGAYANALTSDAATGNFTTTGNAPTISSVSVSTTATSLTATKATFNITGSYDTNASFSSRSIQYGTTTSYGSTATGTEITGLTPNTTYHYRVQITDNFSRTSAWTSDSTFTTTGAVPVINSVTASVGVGTATLTPSISYATNAAFSSYSLKYGTTTSYGNTSTSLSLSSLAHNTKYYYSLTVTDNKSKTSTAYTGNFTTTGNAPTVTVSVSSAATAYNKVTASFAITSTPDTNATISSTVIEYGTTSSYGTTASSASIANLTPYTKYYYRVTVTDSKSKQTVKTGDFTTTGAAPVINTIGATPSVGGVTLALSSVTYSTNATYSSVSVKYGTSTSYGSTSTSLTLSNLAHNTKYYYSVTVTDNKSKTSAAKTGDFTTLGNAPSVTLGTPTFTRSSNKYTAALSVQAVADTNASVSSYSVQYGTTASYGTSITTTSISNLNPNTLYYYRVAVTDNKGNTSSWKTGSFTTPGVAPVITAVSAPTTNTGATLTPTVTFDNTSRASIAVRYGTTTSYGSTASSTTASVSISSLTANTKYYYSLTVTDAAGRTSTAYTGDFTTTGTAPSITSKSATAGVFDCTVSYTASYGTNASFKSVTVEYGTTLSYGSSKTQTSSGSVTITELAANTLYYYRIKVTDNWDRSSSWSTGTFTTLSDQAKARIKTANGWVQGKAWVKTSNGWVKAKKIWIKTANGWKEGV